MCTKWNVCGFSVAKRIDMEDLLNMVYIPVIIAVWRAPQEIIFACASSKQGASKSLGVVWFTNSINLWKLIAKTCTWLKY